MADRHTKEERSYNMSCVKNKDTKPEVFIRKFIFSKGFRYRKNVKELPGCPDIVLPKYKTVIFVHGCFWHKHNCKYASKPKTNVEFWNKKLNGNAKRDKKIMKKLTDLGWHILVIWECEIKKWNKNIEKKVYRYLISKKIY